ncbi:ferritin-like domain-containing protein [Hymenobacter cellulosilyticus]|uniref:Ferritin-like domain-containing protein n=1 Tax=Hymenobacter cellulosilyticus TaxID=2932248 RepID=A0A8T9Q859_9BACT|nr:ferritin-like domain-containing protein [Hymenobacter cellulosilyticus]UOQ73747.1 ferritin-like domain-containing protein [Hymenobacter cellulosilyticus]
MTKQIHSVPTEDQALSGLQGALPRRDFLRYTGAGLALTGLILTGCDDDDDDVDANSGEVNVGSSDIGVLNYAYALEQLEAAFYNQVVTGAAGSYFASLGANSAERQILTDLALHEKAHRDFFKNAIPATSIIKELTPDFSAIDFNVGKRTSSTAKMGVLDAAMAFEDLGVAAYNGAGRFITNPVYLTLAGKIVSVEARHAALIRDMMNYNTFVDADVVDLFTPTANSAPGVGVGTGKEKSKRPSEVVTVANQFLQAGSKLNVSGLV